MSTYRQKNNMVQSEISLRLTSIFLVLILALLLVVAFAFLMKQREARAIRIAQRDVLLEELKNLEDESVRLDQLEEMANEPAFIEQIARNELGMIQEDEKIFKEIP